MLYLGLVFVCDLLSHGEEGSGVSSGRVRFLFPLLLQRVVTTASIISPATKPSTAPRRVAQNQPQLNAIPESSISAHLLRCIAKAMKHASYLPYLIQAGEIAVWDA
jgi:hypothetical protein